MGLSDAISAGIDIAEAKEVVDEGFSDAISTMEGMTGNAGQDSVLNSYVIPAFEANKGPINEGWSDVDIGEYMDFMGDIVNEGNEIMAAAYDEAQEILSELEELAEEAFFEE